MIKYNLNEVAKKFFFGNILAAALFLSMHASAASVKSIKIDKDNTYIDSAKANKLDVKYLGCTASNYEFDVRYNNVKGNTFYFVIKDESGEILFEKEYNNKQFHKRVELIKVDDYNKLTFSIINDKESIQQSKDVVIKTKFVEDVLVKIN